MNTFLSGLTESLTVSMGVFTAIIAILIGLVSLFFGRKLYWLFVGVAGFLLGLSIGPLLFPGVGEVWQLIISLIVAVVFAILAIFLNKFMVALAGGVGLGWLVYVLATPNLSRVAVIIVTVIAAIVGLLIAWFLFDWGLMVFSSLAGASLTTQGVMSLIPVISQAAVIIYLVLLILGLVFQISVWTRERPHETV